MQVRVPTVNPFFSISNFPRQFIFLTHTATHDLNPKIIHCLDIFDFTRPQLNTIAEVRLDSEWISMYSHTIEPYLCKRAITWSCVCINKMSLK